MSLPNDPLLRPEDFGARLDGHKIQPRTYREPARETLRRWQEGASGLLARRPNVRRGLVSALAVLLAGSAAFAYVSLRPRAVPDVFDAELADVLDYTLLSDDFNNLSIERRLELLRDISRKLRGMGSGDSASVAAFAEGIQGKARDQLRKNAERLAIDVWDKFAKDYAGVKPQDRDAYLDQAAINFARLMRELSGQDADERSDDELLKDMKKQAQRDQQRMPGSSQPINPDAMGGLMKFVNDAGERGTSPAQRDRMAEFQRDMGRHLRGF
jgi:hypothetical protein